MTRAERRARALEMRAMYEAGASLPEIGAKFGVTGEGVRLAILCVGGAMRSRSEAGCAKWADPAFNPLVALTESERADYDVLKKAGYTRAEALRAIGRADLIGESEAA